MLDIVQVLFFAFMDWDKVEFHNANKYWINHTAESQSDCKDRKWFKMRMYM